MLQDKFKKVMSLMIQGKYIEVTNGLSKIDGMHLTKKDLQFLKGIGYIKRKEFVGKYSALLELTDKAKTKINEYFQTHTTAAGEPSSGDATEHAQTGNTSDTLARAITKII